MQSFFQSFIFSLKEVLDKMNSNNNNQIISPKTPISEEASPSKSYNNLVNETIRSGCNSLNARNEQRFLNKFSIKYLLTIEFKYALKCHVNAFNFFRYVFERDIQKISFLRINVNFSWPRRSISHILVY